MDALSPVVGEFPAERAAERLWDAWCAGDTVPELAPELRPADEQQGFAVQRALGAFAGPGYGWKIAATSTAGQEHIGVSGPLPGRLFDRFRHEPGERLSLRGNHMRVVEAEFAFVLARDVEDPDCSDDDVLDAVSAMHLAVEVPDSRFTVFERVGAPSLLADDACAGRFVLGPPVPDWRGLDLAAWPTALWINGERAATGRGGNVLGDPRTALAWLARELPRFGTRLRAGEVITTGTTTTPPEIADGDEVTADFGDCGTVAVRFGQPAS